MHWSKYNSPGREIIRKFVAVNISAPKRGLTSEVVEMTLNSMKLHKHTNQYTAKKV